MLEITKEFLDRRITELSAVAVDAASRGIVAVIPVKVEEYSALVTWAYQQMESDPVIVVSFIPENKEEDLPATTIAWLLRDEGPVPFHCVEQALLERFKPGLEPNIELFMKLMFASGVVWDHKPKMGVLPLPEEALSLAPQELINLLIEMLEADEEAEEDAE